MISKLILDKMKQGPKGGARRGSEYLCQIEEIFFDGIKGLRIRNLLYVNSKFGTLHIRTMTQYGAFYLHSSY